MSETNNEANNDFEDFEENLLLLQKRTTLTKY